MNHYMHVLLKRCEMSMSLESTVQVRPAKLDLLVVRNRIESCAYIDNILTGHAKLKYGIQFFFFGHS